MAQGKLVFHQIIQDSQDFGGDDQHMVSRAFFNVELENRTLKGLHSDIKQTVGTDYETSLLEVDFPEAIRGLIPYGVFRKHVERYYRDSFGASGRMFRIGPGAQVRMRHNIVRMVKEIEVEVSDPSKPTGW